MTHNLFKRLDLDSHDLSQRNLHHRNYDCCVCMLCVSAHDVLLLIWHLCVRRPTVDLYLEVALVRVEDDRLFSVVEPLHLQRQPADCRLEVALLCIHHQADTVLQGMLEKEIKFEDLNKLNCCFAGWRLKDKQIIIMSH